MNVKGQRISVWVWVILCGMLVCPSCQKDADTERPSIVIYTPQPGHVLSVPDSVLVVADIYDNKSLEYIRVGLQNEDKISVTDPSTYYPNGSYYHIEQYVRAVDKNLGSGNYFILVFASDGVNTKSEYIPVTVNEIPKELSGYLVLERESSLETRLSYLFPSLGLDTSFVIPEKYASSALNFLNDQFYFVTPQPSVINAFTTRAHEFEWSVQSAPPYAEYTGIFGDGDLIAGSANGDIFVFGPNGMVKVNTIAEQDRKVREVSANERFIVCEMTSLNANDTYLYTYYRQTGGLNKSRKVTGDIKVILPMNDKFLVVVAMGNTSQIYSLEPEEGVLTIESSLSQEIVSHGTIIDDHKALLATGERIYIYDFQYNSLSLFVDDFSSGMDFDSQNNALFYILDSQVKAVRYPSGEQIGTLTFSSQVLNFHCIYNK